MKKMLIVLTILFASIIFFAFLFLQYWNFNTAGAINDSGKLSSRAKQYLDNKKNQGKTEELAGLVVDSVGRAEISQNITVEDCFSVYIPVSIKVINSLGNCRVDLTIHSPSGSVIAYIEPTVVGGFNDISHITMRRSQPELYKESMIMTDIGEMVAFNVYQENMHYEKTGFVIVDGGYLVITLSVPTAENLDTIFEEMVKTIVL